MESEGAAGAHAHVEHGHEHSGKQDTNASVGAEAAEGSLGRDAATSDVVHMALLLALVSNLSVSEILL